MVAQPQQGDAWSTLPVVCKGGIDLSVDILTLGTQKPGAAVILQNYEPSVAGGYSRVTGYTKYDTATVPGDIGTPILGVGVALGGVFAARHSTSASSNDIYFSTGSGWGSKINTSSRPGSVNKMRMLVYAMAAPSIMFTDGVNPAAKYSGSTYTVINGTGAPTAPKYAEAMATYVALAQGNQLYCSAPNSDTDFNGADGAVQFNIGDTITGIKRFRDTLYIFCQTSIWELSGFSSTTFQLDTVAQSISCVSGDTVIEVGGDLIYLAPDGFRSLSATYRIGDLQLGLLSKQLTPLLITNSFINGSFADYLYTAVHIHEKNQYRAWVYDSSTSKSLAFGVVGKRIDDPINVQYEWGTLQGIQPYCAHSEFVGGKELIVIGDPVTGFVYRLENGDDFDGTAVSYIYQTPALTFNDPAIRKVVQKLSVYTQMQGNASIAVNVLADINWPAENAIQSASIPLMYTSSSALYGSGIYGTSVYSAAQNPTFKFPIVGSGFLMSLQFSGTDSNPPHRIDSFAIEFSEQGRR